MITVLLWRVFVGILKEHCSLFFLFYFYSPYSIKCLWILDVFYHVCTFSPRNVHKTVKCKSSSILEINPIKKQVQNVLLYSSNIEIIHCMFWVFLGTIFGSCLKQFGNKNNCKQVSKIVAQNVKIINIYQLILMKLFHDEINLEFSFLPWQDQIRIMADLVQSNDWFLCYCMDLD